MTKEIYIGTWGAPDNLKGYPLGHPRDTALAIERHKKMLYDLYLPNNINFIVFDPYFIALDKIPSFKGLDEIKHFKSNFVKFNRELDDLGIIRYGHNSHYCHFLSENIRSRERSIHEIEYLLELAKLINLTGIGIHLSGNSNANNTVEQSINILSRFTDNQLKRIYLENMPNKAGRLDNILSIANQLPINIAFDIGHYLSSSYEQKDIFQDIERLINTTKTKALFIHLSNEVNGIHKNLDIAWCINFINNLNNKFDVDLHIDVESPDRINDCILLKHYFNL